MVTCTVYPDKYVKDLESSSNRSRMFFQAAVSAVFLVFFYFLGPLIHELSHIAVLELVGCTYRSGFGFNFFTGLYGVVRPLCTPDDSVLMLFYSSGYLSTLLIGSSMNFSALDRDGLKSSYLAAAGTGTLLSVLMNAGVSGDVSSFLELAGLQGGTFMAYMLLLVVVLLTSFKDVILLVED